MEIFFYAFPFFIGILGMLFGSFANVVIYRLRYGGDILWDRSHCPSCNHTLGAFDLVPIFSWLFLRGKCRYCSVKISFQYPFVELLFALSWATIAFFISVPSEIKDVLYFLFLLYLISSFIIITVYDLLYYEIPDQVSLPTVALSLLALFFLPNFPSPINAFWAALIAYTFFYLQILIPSTLYALREKKFSIIRETLLSYIVFPLWVFFSFFIPQRFLEKTPLFSSQDEEEEEVPSWIGGGDLRLALLMGILLGVQGVLVGLFMAYVIGALISILLIIVQKKERKSMIPFGPFLILGTLIALFWAGPIWSWYWGLV